MNYQQLTIKSLLLILCFSALSITVKAQSTKALNQLLPMYLMDKRGGVHKTIGGAGFYVGTTITLAIKFLDGCDNQIGYGFLSINITWYDLKDETAKYTLDVMKQLGGFEQEKQSFLGEGDTEDFAGGNLRLTSSSKACVNELTGPTGEMGYYTEARYYCFTGTTFIELSIHSAIKPETIKPIIAKIAEGIRKFDFSVYKNVFAEEKEHD